MFYVWKEGGTRRKAIESRPETGPDLEARRLKCPRLTTHYPHRSSEKLKPDKQREKGGYRAD